MKILNFKSKLLASALLLFGMSSIAQLNGTYSIGSGGDFNTLGEAVSDLNATGISGPVKFVLKDGIFQERVVINSFSGASASDTLLIVSESNDPTVTYFEFDPSSYSSNYLIKLNGCERVTIRNIGFKSNSTVYSTLVKITNGASYNTIDKCSFDASTAMTTTDDTATVILDEQSGVLEEFNTYSKNTVNGGGIAIVLAGETNKIEHGNVVIENVFKNQVEVAVSIINNGSGKFESNTIKYSQSGDAAIFSLDSLYEVVGNRIFSSGSSGLYINGHDWITAKDTLFVANNMISCPNGAAFLGKYLQGVVIAHNTLFSESTSNYTLALDNINSILALNNLLINNANKGVIQITNQSGLVGSDFNGMFSGDGTVGLRDSGPINNFAAWQASVLNPDANSSFSNFAFQDNYENLIPACGMSSNFKITNYLSALSHDINGVKRDPIGFWAGAAEPSLPENHTIDLSGLVSDGTDTIKNVMIEVYADTSERVMLDLVYSASADPDGSYNFTGVPYAYEYWIKLIPHESLEPDYITGYHNGSLRWDEGISYVATDSCAVHVEDIFSRKLQPLELGSFTISGNVSEVGGANKVEGTDPIPGLDVVLDKIPPVGNTVATTTTDSYGNYSFGNLPEGIYVVSIDYEGLPADTIYQVTLDSESDSVFDLNYCVDSLASIQGCSPSITNVNSIKLSNVSVFPNPVTDFITVKTKGEFNLQILDIEGRLICQLNKINNTTTVSMANWPAGVYFVNISNEQGVKSIKVIK